MSGRLFDAIAAGDRERVRELVEAKPELAGTRSEEGLSPLLHALYNGEGELVDVLLEANPPLDVFDAAAVGRTRGLQELLDDEPELARAWSPDGFTALHYAAFFGQEDAARILLERGSDPLVVARHAELQVVPIQSAAAGKHPAIVKLLLEHGADPSARHGGSTPLHSAAANDDRESVEALLEAGADPAVANDDGKTPADLAGDDVRHLL